MLFRIEFDWKWILEPKKRPVCVIDLGSERFSPLKIHSAVCRPFFFSLLEMFILARALKLSRMPYKNTKIIYTRRIKFGEQPKTGRATINGLESTKYPLRLVYLYSNVLSVSFLFIHQGVASQVDCFCCAGVFSPILLFLFLLCSTIRMNFKRFSSFERFFCCRLLFCYRTLFYFMILVCICWRRTRGERDGETENAKSVK